MRIFCLYFLLTLLASTACKKKVESTHPLRENITESVYASGTVKSQNQYQVFATISGIIQQIYVEEGDSVKKGTPLFAILNETSKLVRENAQLAAQLADYNANAGRLNELSMQVDLARNKMINDSTLWVRQNNLWAQSIGSKTELEKAELNFQNSKTNYQSAKVRYTDEKRKLDIASKQALKNLQITRSNESDFTVKSNMDGRVYSLLKEQGEIVTPQLPLAVIGDARNFILELQVDEYDITKVKQDQQVFVTMDSYKGEVFEARVTRIYPIMNERSKTFTVEAEFVKSPPSLYPNLSLEANIVIQVKENVLTLPRKFVLADQYVIREDGDTLKIKLGVKDYQKAEILEGINENDVVILPNP
jgi:multidrug efflux pump subunit AcrA (membrane-fusion protein)